MRIRSLVCLIAGLLLAGTVALAAQAPSLQATPRGVFVETDRYRATITNGILTSFFNKLTQEEYLEQTADLTKILPHLPSGLATQNSQAAFDASANFYARWPWCDFPTDMYLPNQHYPTGASTMTLTRFGDAGVNLTYQGLTDGKLNFPDESFSMRVEVDPANGDLLLTPSARSPRPGVYGAFFTVPPLGPGITAEAPIFDGLHITPDMVQKLWINPWGSFWDYQFMAFNGHKTGAVGLWSQDLEMRYKFLFFMVNKQGISMSMYAMNPPPFDKQTQTTSVTWHMQAFDKSWAQAAARFRNWRQANVKIAPRPDWVKHLSFINHCANANKINLDMLTAYLGPDHLDRTLTFASTVRRRGFDTCHWDNTPYSTFKDEMPAWKASNAKLMAYLQPMIMWYNGDPPTKDDQKIIDMADKADTHCVFQKNPNDKVLYFDQHHLGDPVWQKWFLDWVHSYISDYGADGVYHDQSYYCPPDNRGLINGMNSAQGMADYFYKAATRDPNSVHGTEHLTEVNSIGASLGIGGGLNWGPADTMRWQKIKYSSPVSAALNYPNAVIWCYPHFSDYSTHANALWYHWGMDEIEARSQTAGVFIQRPELYLGKIAPYEHWVNELELDRTRSLLFVNYGLRPVFPEDWDRDVVSYFEGANGEKFQYERMPWGTRFVQVNGNDKVMQYARIHGAMEAGVDGAVSGWIVYNNDEISNERPDRYFELHHGPAGLNPAWYYCVDPNLQRPTTYFSAKLVESYVEDGEANDHFALLRVRPVPSIAAINNGEQVTLHSPRKPKLILVNGEKKDFDVRPDGGYHFSFQVPADICVLFDDPQPGFDALKQNAIYRMVTDMNMDNFDASWMKDQLKSCDVHVAGMDKTLPGLTGNGDLAKVLPQHTFEMHLMVMPPATAKSGTLKIYLAGDKKKIKEFAVNGIVQDVMKDRTNTPPLEVKMKAGESKVLSLSSNDPLTCGFDWVEDTGK